MEKEKKPVPVTIYAEMTPNPATMKFVADILLIQGGKTVEYNSIEETEEAPLAARLFSFPFVTSVFISGNFVTVTQNLSVDWQDIFGELREYISNYILTGHPIFTEDAILNDSPDVNESSSVKEEAIITHVQPQSEIELKIVELLEEYVRPAVESDGGAIHFNKYEDGKLTVVLKGACSGCPSSSQTLKNGMQGVFDQMMPEVKEIVALEQ